MYCTVPAYMFMYQRALALWQLDAYDARARLGGR